jgi:outer membrane lipoprotein-sorting protein
MTRRLLLLVVIVTAAVALAGVPTIARQQTVDDVIAKNVLARGGLEKLRGIQSVKQTSRSVFGGMEVTTVIYRKRPNMMRQEMTMGGQAGVVAFDGQTAWQVNPAMGVASPTPVSGSELEMAKEQADFDGTLVDSRQKGYTIELVGAASVDGKRAVQLRISAPGKRVQHCYLDADTGLEMKVVSESPQGPIETQMSDYRDVDGVKFPFLLRFLQGGVERARLQVEKVELNAAIENSMFRMPGR